MSTFIDWFKVHEVYIDPSADPTQLVREVNIANTKKLAIRIVKVDKETKVPLENWKFDVYFNDAHLTSVTTDSNGEAMLEGLQPGTYRIKEADGDTEHYNIPTSRICGKNIIQVSSFRRKCSALVGICLHCLFVTLALIRI